MLKNKILKKSKKTIWFKVKNEIAIIDREDFENLPNVKVGIRNQQKYGDKQKYLSLRINEKLQYLHRVLNSTPTGFVTDHISGDTLDNRKSNLQTLTQKQNIFKQKDRKRELPRGVIKERYGYRAQLNSKYIGLYPTPQQAHKAYEVFAKHIYGEGCL